eukprot:CAMPEP_0114369994 /NCGR_PEP_ID=MMETSP0101-20121206/32127_1 /TAXON_ID=38822 ORGANISM="Pteridomonas danica, Strain PT" /NCGR_SAMPLE_ID=MMETSP0101 /ASSEMBLY_ACC=CAM_ASM_000211 /LENGTH=175 /DNA_ID=CAMNT_0001521201 /DNA_START=201 /DNA_END=728 /DNA_ORIENTATION=+
MLRDKSFVEEENQKRKMLSDKSFVEEENQKVLSRLIDHHKEEEEGGRGGRGGGGGGGRTIGKGDDNRRSSSPGLANQTYVNFTPQQESHYDFNRNMTQKGIIKNGSNGYSGGGGGGGSSGNHFHHHNDEDEYDEYDFDSSFNHEQPINHKQSHPIQNLQNSKNNNNKIYNYNERK